LKSFAEDAYDTANRLTGGRTKAALFRSAALLERAGESGETPAGVEGSWHGNDTVWRMSLDLQRLLRYGRVDGTMGDAPAREIVTVTDAIIAGEGEGPLASTPYPLGLLTLAPAAVGGSTPAARFRSAPLRSSRTPSIVSRRSRLRPATSSSAAVAPHVRGRLSAFGGRFAPPSNWRSRELPGGRARGPSERPRSSLLAALRTATTSPACRARWTTAVARQTRPDGCSRRGAISTDASARDPAPAGAWREAARLDDLDAVWQAWRRCRS
jgi:hypothetical protein